MHRIKGFDHAIEKIFEVTPSRKGLSNPFIGGPHSDLGHRRRATYQWRSQRGTSKGSKKGCGHGERV